MKAEEIITIMKAMEEHDLSSFELCEGNLRLALRRGHEPIIVQQGAAAPAAAMPAAEPVKVQASPEAKAETSAEKEPEEKAPEKKEGNIVKSPLVGTFYAASSPDAEPYVKPGDKVKKGQVLGIIEAMKLMNEIESEYEGTVEEILVSNEEVVEYGQPLYKIV